MNHGLGFDWADADSLTLEDQVASEGTKSRKIAKTPYKVLDAPNL